MAWYNFKFNRTLPAPAGPAVPAAFRARSLTAAAVPAEAPLAQYLRHTDRWQNECWGYYDTLGEFNYAVTWLANMMSRVRLRAGQLAPDNDEPTVLDTGLPAELIQKLGKGIGGKSEIMRRLTVHLAVPGECYLIGETQPDGTENWMVRAVDEVRAMGGQYQVTEEYNPLLGNKWRNLAPDSAVIRVWQPHARFYHLADSPARSALTIMQELELVNRHITAQYLSRLASAGVLILPDEITFPVREEFADQEDPFMSEWIEIAATAIKKPGTASSVVPIPLRVPAEFIGDIKLIDFTLKIDDQILEKRDQVIRRLATKLDIPSDVMLGLADANHWCVPDHVRIWTQTGWAYRKDLAVGDAVLTLNHATGLSEWQPLEAINTWDVTAETMVRIKTPGHESLSTEAHRWPVVTRSGARTWMTSADLRDAYDISDRHLLTWNADDGDLAAAVISSEPYTGTVWCPTTGNGTWLAEDNGHVFYTGNSAWAVEESGLKVHIAPYAEIICDSLTKGYLTPRLTATPGVDATDIVTWYDMSELTLRPDRSQNAMEAFDRMELSPKAYRREAGFDEDDAPTTEDLKNMGLKSMIRLTHGATPAAFDLLIGEDLMVPATAGPGAVSEIAGPVPEPGQPEPVDEGPPVAGAPPGGPPQAGSSPPPSGGTPPSKTASAELRAQQSSTQHALVFRTDGRWDLKHPAVCTEYAYSCPFTHAVVTDAPVARPGAPGTYVCHLDAFGLLRIDGMNPYLDTTHMVSTVLQPSVPRVNGTSHA